MNPIKIKQAEIDFGKMNCNNKKWDSSSFNPLVVKESGYHNIKTEGDFPMTIQLTGDNLIKINNIYFKMKNINKQDVAEWLKP